MTPSLFTCTWLLLPYCVLVTLSTGELEFYQDGIPETPEDIALRQFVRLLEAESHQHHQPQRTHLSPFLRKPANKKHHLELDRQSERNPFPVIDKTLADFIRRENLESWYYRQLHNAPVNGIPLQREYDPPYYEVNPLGRSFDEPWIKLAPYLPYKQDDERSNLKNEDLEYPRDLASPKHSFYDGMDLTVSKGMKEEESMPKYPGNFRMPINEEEVKDDGRKLKQSVTTQPEFTFKFDDSNLSEKHPFAVKPNDPRYYLDTPFSSDTNEMEDESKVKPYRGNLETRVNEDSVEDEKRDLQKPSTDEPEFTFQFEDSNLSEKHPFAVKPNDPRYYQDTPFSAGDGKTLTTLNNDTKWERPETMMEKDHATREHEESTNNEAHQFQGRSMVTLPEPERRTGYHPLIVPVTHDLNNDIYFIAIVAGCSAAAMFALVLISLTWCRLQRGAKAAADIEYPAYGVTGPNKDVSPSGDQRLAQSAQMYHFQHQKQQIIAMENRTSATRDPGSVSEAESDEENEEGDYTVYECPGLASTGEMEVKNPLFHDDPTPATPAQSNKEEDHI